MATAHGLAQSMMKAADSIPKAAQRGAVEAGAIMVAAVATTSGKYAYSKLTRTRATIIPTGGVLVRMTSRKAHLLDHASAQHDITARRAPFLVFMHQGHLRRETTVHHPGVKVGKMMWEKALVLALPKMEAVIDQSIGDAIVKPFL